MLTAEQVQNWKDFSLRMAKTCYAKYKNVPLDWIISEIKAIFDEIGDAANLYISWDECHPYPEGHKYYGMTYRIKNAPMYLCDLVMEMTENPIYYNPSEYCSDRVYFKLQKLWDEDIDKYDELRKKIVDRWAMPVHCCIRAGIDQVGEQSAGVIGFDVGDILNMYPEGIPDWLQANFTKDLNSLPKGTEILL